MKIITTRKLLKLLDALVGRIITRCLFASASRPLPAIINILFIRPGGIGDAVLLIPAIEAVKKAFPVSSIDVLAEERNGFIFSLSASVRAVVHYERLGELFFAMRSKYDVVIDTEQWHRLSAVVARLTSAPMSIGFATNERKKLFTHQVEYSHDNYEVHSFLHLVEPITGEAAFDPEKPFLNIPERYLQSVESHFESKADNKLVAIFPGGSIRERKWGSDRFHQTASLLSRQGYGIVVVGGMDDIRDGAEIINGLSHSLNLCGKLSLPETAAVLQKSSLLITGDSGIMHIGYGLGIKIVALFGPGREKKWAPRGKNCVVINKNLPCSPCTTFGYTPKCKRNAECMRNISVEEVFRESMLLLEDGSSNK